MTDLLSKEELDKLKAAAAYLIQAVSNPATREYHRLALRSANEAIQRREAAEKPVAVICDTYELRYVGSGPISKLPVKVGAKLYLEPLLTSAERERLAAAENTLSRIGYSYNGGKEWKPPLGPKPNFNLPDIKQARIDELEARLAAYDRAAIEQAIDKLNSGNGKFLTSDEANNEMELRKAKIRLKHAIAPLLPVVPDEFNAIIKHLQDAHNFIENTEAFGHSALNGILQCGDDKWDIDASKEALSVCRAAMLQLSGNSEQVDHSVDANEKANSPVIPEGSTPTRYMNRFTGMCYTLDQQPGADADTDVYVPLYERKPAKNTN